MHRRSTHLRHAGLALLAALALAALPTLARALQPMAATPVWAELCRNTGGADAAHALQACGYCVLAATPLLPPSTPALQLRCGSTSMHRAAAGTGRPHGPVRTVGAARAPPIPA